MIKQIDGWLTAPKGFVAAGVKAGIKKSGKEDVAVIMSEVPASAGAVFTQNKMCAAPVVVSREAAAEPYAQAIVVNSGCANACTGARGIADAREMAVFTAEMLGIPEKSVFCLFDRRHRAFSSYGQDQAGNSGRN
jgi:glutamate N-acetyltransferase/amino-acid N-acetyltransferase